LLLHQRPARPHFRDLIWRKREFFPDKAHP